MWYNGKEKCGKSMTAPITLSPLDKSTSTELRRRYEETADAETRTRYQMLFLSARGQTSSQVAQIVLRSQGTAVRVLKRFKTSGIEWLWHVLRQVVTHNHHRSEFALLLADVAIHFQALIRTLADVLRHIGSPFVPDKDAPQSQAQAA